MISRPAVGPDRLLGELEHPVLLELGMNDPKDLRLAVCGNRPTTRYLPIAAGNGASLGVEPASSLRGRYWMPRTIGRWSGDSRGAVASA